MNNWKIFAFTLMQSMLFQCAAYSQATYSSAERKLTLDNGSVRRIISFRNDSAVSTELKYAGSGRNYIRRGSEEFRFMADGRVLSGTSGWKLLHCKTFNNGTGGSGATVFLSGTGDSKGTELEITYTTYKGLPLIRKKIAFRNSSASDIRLESVDVEALLPAFDYVSTWVCSNYARMKSLGTFTGNWDDPVVVIHNTGARAGIAIGNEAPGVLKRTVFHTADRNLDAGLTHPGQDFPFRKWLKPGERWESPATFIALYEGTDDPYRVVNTVVNDFVRKHLGTRISSINEKPLFVYNTWYPFRTFINDSLVRDVARAAAECGIQEFIIDDGWQYNYGKRSSDRGWGGNYGDWLVDRNKFPDDLGATFDYIRSLGMKPGLWISIGSATSDSRVFADHPGWFVKNKDGHTGNLHSSSPGGDFYTSCFGTDWVKYIKDVILRLVKEHGLAYTKLDLSIVTSAYVNDPSVSGCYATDHPGHRDHEESFIAIYENVLKLFDELHSEAPELFIDCTFETAGKLQLQDYAFAMHAEGNWLSNIEEPFPTGALRMRHLAWWRSPALPAGSLVIGNLPLDSKNLEFDLKSLIGALPIVLGDPRKLSAEQKASIKKWSGWMAEMQKKYDYMSFRQDLPGFGEPAEGRWDGWSRINTETRKGGIIGIFRQGAMENSRKIVVEGLDPEKTYSVILAPDNKIINNFKGALLMKEGFTIALQKEYDGNIYEIRQVNNQ